MGFFSKMLKHDQELEEQQRKRAMELQVELWKKQAEMGKPVNIQADMEKIYGLDKIEQKQREKQQTKEIIKGAVIGGIVAGDAGAVVGAMVSKNNIENRNNSNVTNAQPITITYTQPEQPMPFVNQNVSDTVSVKEENPSSSQTQESLNVATALNYYGSDAWESTKNILIENGFTRTDNLQTDILYCLSRLKIAFLGDLMDVLSDEKIHAIRSGLNPLMDDGAVKRIEHNGRAMFIMVNANFENQAAAPVVPSSNVNKFEEIKQYKELLDLGILSQEEFEVKKSQLLGLNTVIQNNSRKETISDTQIKTPPQNVVGGERNIDLQIINKYYKTIEWRSRKNALNVDFKKAKTNNIEQDFLYVVTRLQIAQKYDVLSYFFEEQDALFHAIDGLLKDKKVEQATVNNRVYYFIPGTIK